MQKRILKALKKILPVDLYRLVVKSNNPNQQQPRTLKTPLHFMAIACGNPQLFQDMIQLGADVNLQDANGMTPLHLVAHFQNSVDIVNLLVAAGADVNHIDYFRFSPLIKAAMGDKKEGVVEALLQAGADVHHIDVTGRTAIDMAGNDRTRTLLRNAGCHPGPKVPTLHYHLEGGHC